MAEPTGRPNIEMGIGLRRQVNPTVHDFNIENLKQIDGSRDLKTLGTILEISHPNITELEFREDCPSKRLLYGKEQMYFIFNVQHFQFSDDKLCCLKTDDSGEFVAPSFRPSTS
jgi:hypothetical protein